MAGGLGFAPIAPGTFGSLLGAVVFLVGFVLVDGREAIVGGRAGLAVAFCVAVTGVLLLGIRASDDAGRHFGRADDGRIVIDEVVGQLIALAPLLVFVTFTPERTPELESAAGSMGAVAAQLPARPETIPFSSLLGWVVTGFVAFRVFDIWKPGPVRWAERGFEGGVGVMADDVVAGLGAAGLLAGLIGLRASDLGADGFSVALASLGLAGGGMS